MLVPLTLSIVKIVLLTHMKIRENNRSRMELQKYSTVLFVSLHTQDYSLNWPTIHRYWWNKETESIFAYVPSKNKINEKKHRRKKWKRQDRNFQVNYNNEQKKEADESSAVNMNAHRKLFKIGNVYKHKRVEEDHNIAELK